MKSFLPKLVTLLIFGSALIASAAAPPIERVAAVRSLTSDQAGSGLPVRLRGIVTLSYPKNDSSIVLQDESAGVYLNRALQEDPTEIEPGSLIEVTGVTAAGAYAPIVKVSDVKVLGTAPLSTPAAISIPDLLGGKWDCQRVTLQGVVQHVEKMPNQPMQTRLEIAGLGGSVAIHCVRDDGAQLDDLVDAEVRVTGVCFSFFNSRKELVGAHLLINRRADLEILTPPPAAPFAVPELTVSTLRAFSAEGPTFHRRRVTGTVTMCRPGEFFYLQQDGVGIRVQTRSAESLPVGAKVEASGFTELAQNFGQMRDARVRRISAGQLIVPRPTSRHEILGHGADRIASARDLDGTLVSIEGQLENVEYGGVAGQRLFVSSEGYVITGTLSTDTPRAELSALAPGSRVRMSGICVVELASSWPARASAMPMNFSLLLRTPRDVEVLEAPSWWNKRRLFYAMSSIGSALLLALLWANVLRRQVARRGAELAGEIRAHSDAASAFAATMHERRRLAADLHDTLEQALTALALQLKAVEKFQPEDPARGAHHLHLARQFLARSREDVRRSVWNLRAQGLEGRSLQEALHDLERLSVASPETRFHFSTVGEPFPVPEFIASQLLLLAQEAVTNALKHGTPRLIELQLSFTPSALTLCIQDDAGGFDPAHSPGPDEGHFGLLGMRERMHRLGGTLDVASASGAATRITVRLPRQALTGASIEAEAGPA